MRILEQSNTRLVLREMPIFLWLFGGVFAVSGLLVMLALREGTLTCRRPEPSLARCVVSNSSVLGLFRTTTPVEGLSGAYVHSSTDSDGDTTYQVILLTADGEVELTGHTSSGFEDKDAVVQAINAFLADPLARELSVQQDERLFGAIFGGIFVAVGTLVGAGMGRIVTADFNKSHGTLTLTRRGLLGNRVDEYPIRNVVDVNVDSQRGSKGGTTYRVSLRLSDGQAIAPVSYFSSGSGGKRKAADAIRDFLSLRPPDAEAA